MFGIRELKERICAIERRVNKPLNIDLDTEIAFVRHWNEILELKSRIKMLETPKKYQNGDMVNGVIICCVQWRDELKGCIDPEGSHWEYYGVKKGNNQLIEVK